MCVCDACRCLLMPMCERTAGCTRNAGGIRNTAACSHRGRILIEKSSGVTLHCLPPSVCALQPSPVHFLPPSSLPPSHPIALLLPPLIQLRLPIGISRCPSFARSVIPSSPSARAVPLSPQFLLFPLSSQLAAHRSRLPPCLFNPA